MKKEDVDVFHHRQLHQPHPLPAPGGRHLQEVSAIENGKKYFSVASGGGTGRTLHPDNVAAGPASYGLTDSHGPYARLTLSSPVLPPCPRTLR